MVTSIDSGSMFIPSTNPRKEKMEADIIVSEEYLNPQEEAPLPSTKSFLAQFTPKAIKEKIQTRKVAMERLNHIKEIRENKAHLEEKLQNPKEITFDAPFAKELNALGYWGRDDRERRILQKHISEFAKEHGGVEYNLKNHDLSHTTGKAYNILVCRDGEVFKTPKYQPEAKPGFSWGYQDPEEDFAYLEFPEAKETISQDEADRIKNALSVEKFYKGQNTYKGEDSKYTLILPSIQKD